MRGHPAVLMLALALAVACGGGGATPTVPQPATASATAPTGSASPAAPAAPPSRERAVFGSTVPTLSTLPVYLAEVLGYYQEEGLASEHVQLSGSAINPALISGEIDFSTVTASAATAAAQGGTPRVVQMYSTKLQHVITVRPEITRVEQLSGKRFGVNGLGTLTAFEARKVAEYYGLRDIALLALGTDLERIAALEVGAVDASPLSVPSNIIAEQRGLPTLLRIADISDAPQTGLATTTIILRERPDVPRRAMRAAARAIPVIHGQREMVIDRIAAWLDMPRAEAARAYEQVEDTYSPNGLLTNAQMAAYLEMLRETAGVGPDVTAAQIADFTSARAVATELGLPSQ